ncbi:MAG: WcbI family polysaccharide biosynthesis putative acetyltransferase [Pseudomonadota bacterium]
MSFLFFGNCQLEMIARALSARNPSAEIIYRGNSSRARNHDPAGADQAMAAADRIVSQPILNANHPEHHTTLRARLGARLLFLPYLWLDGLFSLVEARQPPDRRIIGAQVIRKALAAQSRDDILARFAAGEIAFDHASRLRRSLAELTRRESFCDIGATDILRAGLRERPLMVTHNHPAAEVTLQLARRLAPKLGLLPPDPDQSDGLHLPVATRVLSPQTTRDLGLTFPPDPDWLAQGTALIDRIAKA